LIRSAKQSGGGKMAEARDFSDGFRQLKIKGFWGRENIVLLKA